MSTPGALLLGLDFGGTKLAAGLVDRERRTVVLAARRLTGAADAAQSLEAMLAMARGLIAKAAGGVAGVGINFGGPVDAAAGRVLRSHHVVGWEDVPLAARVTEALGLPARLENDANGQALAEWHFGAARGNAALVYLNIGTGIGGGVVLDGHLWRGRNGLAGEFGHLPVRPDGPPCPCGRRGCLEALAAGPALARRAQEALAALSPARVSQTVLFRRAGSVARVSGRDLTAAANEGDDLATHVMDGVLEDLALAIVAIQNSVDPGLVVLGGGAASFGPPLFDRLRQHVRRRCLPGTERYLQIKPAALGADAGIFGGAALFLTT